MSTIKQTITESEYNIMKILWSSERKMTVSEVCSKLEGNEWTPSTVSTFLLRLLKKEVIASEKHGKANYYYPLLKQEEYSINETRSFLSKLYNGSVKNLVASLYDNKEISKDEIDDLKKMFELED